MENKKQEKNKTKSQLFEKVNKIDKYLATTTKGGHTQILKLKERTLLSSTLQKEKVYKDIV